jgi:hypothetical protein
LEIKERKNGLCAFFVSFVPLWLKSVRLVEEEQKIIHHKVTKITKTILQFLAALDNLALLEYMPAPVNSPQRHGDTEDSLKQEDSGIGPGILRATGPSPAGAQPFRCVIGQKDIYS